MRLNKKGSASLVGLVLTTTIVSLLATSATTWYLDINKEMNQEKKQNLFNTSFYEMGNKIKNLSYAEIKENEGKKLNQQLGAFNYSQNYGREGIFTDGKCDTSVSREAVSKNSKKCIEVEYSVRSDNGEVKKSKLVRHSTQVDTVPVGTIIFFKGNASQVPKGWQLCDGTNGTPDLRDVFIMGTTNQSKIGMISGINDYVLKPENLPKTKILVRSSTTKIFDKGTGRYGSFQPPEGVTLYGEVPVSFCDIGGGATVYTHYINANIKIADWQGKSIEKQPPFYKIAYIMRVK